MKCFFCGRETNQNFSSEFLEGIECTFCGGIMTGQKIDKKTVMVSATFAFSNMPLRFRMLKTPELYESGQFTLLEIVNQVFPESGNVDTKT